MHRRHSGAQCTWGGTVAWHGGEERATNQPWFIYIGIKLYDQSNISPIWRERGAFSFLREKLEVSSSGFWLDQEFSRIPTFYFGTGIWIGI